MNSSAQTSRPFLSQLFLSFTRKSYKGFAPILITIFVAVLAVGGIGAGLVWKTDFFDRLLPQNVRELLGKGGKPGEEGGEPIPDDRIKDWKVYVSSRYGYSVKYPPDYTVTVGKLYSYSPEGSIIWITPPDELKPLSTISVSDNPNHQSVEEFGVVNFAADGQEDISWYPIDIDGISGKATWDFIGVWLKWTGLIARGPYIFRFSQSYPQRFSAEDVTDTEKDFLELLMSTVDFL